MPLQPGQERHEVRPAERLHATVAITLDRYSHVLPGLQDEAAMKIDVMLKRSLAAVDSS